MLDIGIIGGGPAGFMLLKKLVEKDLKSRVFIFESTAVIGSGMPYSERGASTEHVTNISSDELPPLQRP